MRTNINELDLNREFPGWRDLGRPNNELVRGRPKEVKAVMSWIQSHYYFVLSISFHDGQVLINYPWDDSPSAVEGQKSVCGDDDVFQHLASLYSDHHAFMWTGKCLCHSESFASGISNGAEWYVVDNGMQDYNYIFSNCMEVTAELSCSKKPPPEKLSVEWENNLDSMLAFLGSVHGGVRGLVTDEQGNIVEGANVSFKDSGIERSPQPLSHHFQVEIFGREKTVRTSPRGEYWRLLLPGSYALTASHSNKFGRLEADIASLEVLDQPGQGAVRRDLVVKFKLYQTFSVTTISSGGPLYYQEELASLFKNCDIVTISSAEKQYVKLRELILTVTVLVNKASLAEYCSRHYYDSNTITRSYSVLGSICAIVLICLDFRPTTIAEDQSLKGKLREGSIFKKR